MFACKPGHRMVWACILPFFCMGAVSKILAEEVLVPKSSADYGSGYTVGGGVFYPGGIPGIGLFLGQPNTQTRNDRALVRFTISPYLLSGSPVDSAKLCFGVAYYYAPEDAHEIEVTHLSYDADSLSVKDMLNARVVIVGKVSVKKGKPTGPEEEYSIDVTKFVNADIAKGNMYSAFRFKDVTAETKTRPNAFSSAYGVCLKNLLQLRLRNAQTGRTTRKN
ncbi:MAG: hypothetical protein HY318_17600 [Armatimonadetes bacterium]|nr:hypothetical protein [Armatimonadota bacterium]